MEDNDRILRYYEAGMRELGESGEAFAHAHPDRAPMLGAAREGERDPYVERLWEGFAFLSGRVQRKLDDERPELVQALAGLLWPHYLRTIPSLSIVGLTASADSLRRTQVVPAGVPVRSTPIVLAPSGDDEERTPETLQCLYRTTQAVTLQPLLLTHAEPAVRRDGRSVIRLGFELSATADRQETDLSRLNLFLDADPPTAFAMHLALTRHVGSIAWRIRATGDEPATGLPDADIRPAGFSDDEALWPRGEGTFSGHHLLLEYFAFREKFLFVDLCGLDVAKLPAQATRFELEIVLTHAYPMDQRFSAANVRLFCTPVINLFGLDAEPVVTRHDETGYRVVAIGPRGGHVETWSVDSVESFDHHTGERREYVPFASFRHRGDTLRYDAPERFFHARVRPGVSGLRETWLTLGGHAWTTLTDLPEESLSLRVTGTNGMLAPKALRESRLIELAAQTPEVAAVRNLRAPTMPLHPPTEDRFEWRSLAHLTPDFLSLMNADVLRGALALYDWTNGELNRRRLEGILHVAHEPLEEVTAGSMECGVGIEVTLDSQAFTGSGDLMLFGEMLHRFFAAHAGINLFTRLAIVSLPAQTRVEWPRSKVSSMKPLAPRERPERPAGSAPGTGEALPDHEPRVAALLARAPGMNFMQLCRLLEAGTPGRPGFAALDTAEHEPVRFRPRARTGFPAGEVASVEFDGLESSGPHAPPTVRTTFMGLYGVDAAMPPHMIDEIVLREEGHEAVEAFLDQFNHRFATLLYRTWKKYRYPESFLPGGADAHSRNLVRLAGFGPDDRPQRAGVPDSRILALLGLLVRRTRTPEGLRAVIALAAPGAGVSVEEFWPVTARVARHFPLAGGPAEPAAGDTFRRGLGRGYVLGQRMTYRSRAACATLRPANAQQANDLLPGAPLHREVMASVRIYIGARIDVHLRMELSSRFVPRPAIGQMDKGAASRLGWTTVLPSDEERTISIGLGVHEAAPVPEVNAYMNTRRP